MGEYLPEIRMGGFLVQDVKETEFELKYWKIQYSVI